MARKPELNKPQETTRIPKCKYAGDPGDEYCKACNGYTMKVEDNGPDISCSECGGYEACSAQEDNANAEEEKKEFMNIPDGIDEELPYDEGDAGKTVEPIKTEVKASKPASNKAADTPVKPSTSKNVEPEDTNYQSKAVVTEIRADSGLSCELTDKNGVKRWYKFNYGETRSIPANADYEAEVKKLWDDVNGTVDDQLQQTVDFLNS